MFENSSQVKHVQKKKVIVLSLLEEILFNVGKNMQLIVSNNSIDFD